ncbi:MAG: HEPN domain-containing protein [Candidatus Thiodiazotropha sp. (ex Lucinoma kastoroae)]|nr:HEPN domain-containing protein [Candidatus Thiodiazotropha sp. (ex Rostrolucina anterorostrata)]MCU7849042.1 HEPN domain-containing protein [Candidatus Thiodiazotropha sp. (ex Lucinoma kastoroae)]MCU7860281.1 HEPN domain-containing protein [Candidatus Thiodiazotropha sp. (ex Lucinoma kastoroae)]
MTLDNLLGMSLERIESDPLTIQRLLEAAKRNIKDAQIGAVSNENRFDAAYKAIMQMANAALQANGYRTLTSKPGHHQTMIQTLPKTMGLDKETMIVLDALRKQRNVADYSGDLVADSAVIECINHAEQLWTQLNKWLKLEHPELVG